jgi:hypothetical protein
LQGHHPIFAGPSSDDLEIVGVAERLLEVNKSVIFRLNHDTAAEIFSIRLGEFHRVFVGVD